MENECKYVSSRGLFKSTDIHNRVAASSRCDLELEEFKKTERGSILYVCNSAIRTFVMETLPFITDRFVLVSGDADNPMPYGLLSQDEFTAFIADKRLQHWFCQNLLITHPKMTHLPIGLDYHTISKVGEHHPWGMGALPIDQEIELEKCIEEAPPLALRYPLCYSNFHHSTWGIGDRGDRKELVESISKEVVFFEPDFTPRKIGWNRQSQLMFVLSPMGGGYDCHRTWEALCLGCIPIVKSSGLDPLYADLPVLIVKNWSDVTRELLSTTLQSFSTRGFHIDKLLLNYWIDLIRQQADLCKL
jgi:hypothetical protein